MMTQAELAARDWSDVSAGDEIEAAIDALIYVDPAVVGDEDRDEYARRLVPGYTRPPEEQWSRRLGAAYRALVMSEVGDDAEYVHLTFHKAPGPNITFGVRGTWECCIGGTTKSGDEWENEGRADVEECARDGEEGHGAALAVCRAMLVFGQED